MSNKIALATIQFRADAKGANVALESLRSSADNARRTVNEMQAALDKGIKTMKDSTGVEFNVADRLRAATKEAKGFESAIRELMKGATALEEVVRNIRLGEIEKSSRAELKGAINAAESRKRSVRGSDEDSLKMQRELNIVIEESRKQLNNLDRDTQKVIETLKNGGTVAESVLNKEQKGLQEILSLIPKGTEEYKQYAAQLKEIKTLVANIKQQEQIKATSLLGDQNLGKYTEEQIRAAIDAGKQLIQTYKTASPEAKALADNIARAEQHLKNYGIEAARAAAKEAEQIKTQEQAEKQLRITMNGRLRELPKLSAEALAETKKYWEAQKAGAAMGSAELAKYEANLKKIVNQEEKRRRAQLDNVLTQPGQYGVAEVKAATQEMEKLRDSVKKGSAAWLHYNKMVEQGKAYLDGLALQKINTQMQNLNTLSAAGLAEVKKYWEAQVSGAALGSKELDEYKVKLEQVTAEEQRRTQLQAQQRVGVLSSGSLGQYTEAQIRQAIEAGQQLIKTYATGSAEAQELAQKIVAAEQHLRQYGVEAERTAAKEAEALKKVAEERAKNDALMKEQLQKQGALLSESALKQQQQYWQRLIDDPKTAASSLQEYKRNLLDVQRAQQAQTQIKGQTALTFFRGDTSNASAAQIKEQADALKKYRDSLPKETYAEQIRVIDEILQRVGATTQKAAEQAMSLRDAYRTGLQSLNGTFKGTTEQLKQAKKTLEEQLAVTEKGTKQYDQLRRALEGVALEEKRIGQITKETQAVLDKPKGKSLNELKIAVEQGRAALASMRTETTQDKKAFDELAAKVKAADFEMKQLQGTSKGTATAFEKAWSRLKTYITLYVGAAVAIQKITASFGDLMELSDKMGEVRKTTGFTADEVGRLAENLKRLDVRTNITDLMTIAAKAGQLGLKTEQDVMGFTEAANKLMIALPEMGAEAATEMMKVAIATGEVKKIQDQINKGLVEGTSATEVALSKIGSTIDQLRANSAAAAPAITDFVKRVGAVGAQSGISIDQVAALGATVDALGMRVEMSATALSRMIPAIKNNAFDVAKAIGVTPDTLRDLFEAGRGMEAILMIFQHIKDSGMDADSIEKLLGLGGMQDIMKQLNQQGARAGIVFAGLSQNVDELRRNLGTAKEAYEDNIAILQEYNKMNETTAAKWERLKNQIEEFFVGNRSNNMLGGFIDDLRWIIDLLTGGHGVGVALRTIIVYITAVNAKLFELAAGGIKSTWFGIKNIGVALGFVRGEMTKMQWANIFTALAAAIYIAYKEISNMKSALDKASESIGKAKEEAALATERFDGYWQKLKSTSEALIQAKANHEKLSAEVDKLRKSTDGSAESTANLKKKEDELETSEKNVTRASNDHKSAIAQINNIYGKYLGFILTEANYSNLAAAAHDKVTAAIEREILMKQKQAAIGEVDSKYSQEIATGYGELNERLVNYAKLTRSEAAKAMSDMQKFMRENMKYDAGLNKTMVSKAIIDQLKKSKLDVSNADANEIAALWFDNYLRKNFHLSDNIRAGVTGVRQGRNIKGGWSNVYNLKGANLRGGYAETYAEREQERGALANVYGVDLYALDKKEGKASATLLKNLEKTALDAKKKILDKNVNDKERNAAYGELANALEALDNRIDELDPKKDAATINRLNEMAKSLKGEGIDIKRLKKAREIIHQTLFERATFNEEDIKNIDTTNPWGSSHEASSTDWKNMNANQLVERRKQMNEFVNAIQTDSDVQSVLKEDAALKAAIEKGMSSDMRTVIEWYNTERLKIQDELHARHLTNTGAWQDPKQQKARQKQFTDEMRAMLEELDAYYTERNQKIQDARNNDEITEGEAWRRTIKNETEWYNRRAELQKLYANRGSEVTAEEQQAIFNIIAEKTGDTAGFIKRSVENTVKFAQDVRKKDQKGEVEYRKWMADLMLGVEKDYLKSAKSIGKQVKFIEETLAKERPYDSITKNLQDNLDKMGILAVRYKRINDELEAQGKEKKYSDAQIKAATYDEMAFYLKNAADAWSIDIDELLRRMVKEGMAVTAEEISKSDMLKQAVMGQLRKTFEEVQNAIKKEASQIKKNVDIIWNDDSQGPGGTSMKAAFEKAISQLGMQQDSVSRANSLINAGFASENVAARLAMKQIEMQMRMQKAQFDIFRVQAAQRIKALTQEAKVHERIADSMAKENQLDEAKKERLMATNALQDAENVKKALGLTLSQETKEQEKQKTELLKLQEESQARLYKELQGWVSLMTKGLQGVFEAANFYNSSDYNNLAVARAGGSFNRTTTETVTNSSSSTTKNASTSRHTSTGTSQTTSTKKTEQGSTAAKEGQSKSSTSKNSASNTDTYTTTSTTGTKTSTSTREKQVDYYIIENAGTKDAVATQVSMTEEEYYEKKIELDRDNAIKDAWKSLLDDLNMKISETITDQINRMFQDAAINANTDASNLNTEALRLNTEGEQQLTAALKELATTEALKVAKEANDFSAAYQEGGNGRTLGTGDMGVDENGVPNALKEPEAEGPVIPKAPWQMTEEERAQAQEGMATLWNSYAEYGTAAMQNMSDATAEMPSIVTNPSWTLTEEQREVAVGNNASLQQQLTEQEITNANLKADGIIAASNRAKDAVIANEQQMGKTTTDTNNQNAKSTQAAMAKMTLATNMYGLAYQVMANDNMSATQKFLMFSVQAAGQAAIAMLTTDMATQEGKSKVELPGILGKAASQLGPIAGPIAFGAMMALLGGLMGMAVSAVSKSKSEIAQATGASTSSNAKSISAGKLMTGMQTYGEGNVNEFTDPSSLTPGRSYNVDSADGKTYRAKYMGVGAKTHLTNGPEFHLVGERGREAIIDAHTTRLMQMDDTGIWQAIQTLYNGGSLRHSVMRRKGRGMAAFADGNIDEFETMADGGGLMAGGAGLDLAAVQGSLDRNTAVQEALLERLNEPIYARNILYGPEGIVNTYDTLKKEAQRHGEKYL